MGRMLGSFDNEDFERSDLNKCPDCKCFFPQDACPLCGKVCPENMRAGNRKQVKKKKVKGPSSTRIGYMEWYHRWWCIIIALLTFPIIGLVLLITSPHKTSRKILFVFVTVAYTIVSTFGLSMIIGLFNKPVSPVDTSLSQDEYVSVCEVVVPQDFYRSTDSFAGDYLTMSLVVVDSFTSSSQYDGDLYAKYYICQDQLGGDFQILVRDCVQEGRSNYIAGDIITVYGEGAGNCEVYDIDYKIHISPCVNAAYIFMAKK